jgi:hypothetical protein
MVVLFGSNRIVLKNPKLMHTFPPAVAEQQVVLQSPHAVNVPPHPPHTGPG